MSTFFEAALPWPLPTRRSTSTASRLRPLRRMIKVDAGQTLRIIDGAELQIVSAWGLLWITEEGDSADHVIAVGDAYEVQYGGRALVTASGRARVLLELPAGAAMPRGVHLVSPADERGVRIDLMRGPRYVHAMQAIVRRARAAWRRAGTRPVLAQSARTEP